MRRMKESCGVLTLIAFCCGVRTAAKGGWIRGKKVG
jgi:hypothetical protein